ncbi:MAG: geranylgeranyl reductase, partial [Aquifex sp.]
MERFDVVVVGAGPAGSSAARFLSEKGLKVLILEKEKLPRFKLCGGALSSRFSRYLPEDFKGRVLNTINRGYLGFRGKGYKVKEKKEVAYIIDRADFDHYLALKAVEKGAELREETELLDFWEDKGKIILDTTRGKISCDFLVGADGFHSRVSKILGFKKEKYYRSVEFLADGEMDFESVIIELGVVSRGYLWVFPKGDNLNIGVASTERENLLRVLEDYIKNQKAIKVKKTYRPRSWFIPIAEGYGELHTGRGRVLLVGDAGNFVDPLLGEGIYYGYLSGLLAGESIIQNPQNPQSLYRERAKEIAKEFYYAGKIAKIAYRFQRVAHRMGGGTSLERYMEFLRGYTTYEELYKKGWIDFLKNLIL